MYRECSRPPLFITFCQMFGRRPTPSARPYLLMFLIDRPIARINNGTRGNMGILVPFKLQYRFAHPNI